MMVWETWQMCQAYNCLPTDLWTFDPATPKGYYFNRGVYRWGRLVDAKMNEAEQASRRGRQNGPSTDALAQTARLGVLSKYLGTELKRYRTPDQIGSVRVNIPDYDLGTAHGKIRIEADSAGVQAVNQAIDQFKRAIDAVTARTAAFDSAMNNMERELKQVRNDFLQASVAANNYNRTLTIVHVSQKDLANSTNLFGRNLNFSRQAMIGATAAAALHYQQLRQIVNITREGQGGLLGFHASLNKLGVANIAVHALWNNFLGVHRVMASAPQWQRSILGFANGIKLATLAYGGFKLFPEVLAKISSHSALAANAIGTLGRVLTPVGNLVRPFAHWFDELATNIGKLPTHIGQAIIGWNVMPGGIKAVVGAIALMGPAIVEGLAASLRFTSNLLVGLLQGLKDLSGAFLVIPGIFAM